MLDKVDALYVEFDLPYCSLSFGQSPCTATGVECFNTRNNSHDCGDPANYTQSTLTLRFVKDNGHSGWWPQDNVPTRSLLVGAKSTSATVDPAETMGTRASCTIALKNSLDEMAGIDKNLSLIHI